MFPTLGRRLGTCLALVLVAGPPVVIAEVFSLQNYEAPDNWMLTVAYLFYVYSGPDAPGGGNANATVAFSNVAFDSAAASDADYKGMQLSFVALSDLMAMPSDFCCTSTDVAVQRCNVVDEIRFFNTVQNDTGHDLAKQTVLAASGKTLRQPITVTLKKSGVYALVVSNCGTRDLGDVSTLQGQVIVKYPYGFLSGLDYPKLAFYLALSGVYVMLGVVWMGLCMVYRAELFKIQYCIGVVLAFGLGEACLWYFTFYRWNVVGSCAWPVFIGATFLSVVKSVFSYMLVLVGSMGWGVTKPQLSWCTACKVVTCSVIFIALDFTRRMVMFFRNTRGDRTVPTSFLFGILVPISVLNGIIFYWIFTSLAKVTEELKEQSQSEKVKLFESLHRVLVFALAAAVLAEVHEMFNLSRSIEEQWRMHWLYADGISHMLFLLVLAGIMCLWRPHENSQRYAFSAQIGDDEVPGVEMPEGMEPTTVGAGTP